MKATLSNYRQSPRKVRLVANLIKGMAVPQAELELQFLAKRAALPFKTLLQAAVANALQNTSIDKKNLVISDVRVDKGVTLKRFMPRARGSAYRINKRSSHISLVLKEQDQNKNGKGKVKKEKSTKK